MFWLRKSNNRNDQEIITIPAVKIARQNFLIAFTIKMTNIILSTSKTIALIWLSLFAHVLIK